jgi:hypothetical protein
MELRAGRFEQNERKSCDQMSSGPFLAKRGSSLFNATIESITAFTFECMHPTGYYFFVDKKLDEAQLNVAKEKLKEAGSVYVKNGWKGGIASFALDYGIQAAALALKFDLSKGVKPLANIQSESTERIRALAKELRADKVVHCCFA